MAKIPQVVRETDLSRKLLKYLPRTHQGKVRDTYAIPKYPTNLVLATERLSIFDVVLNCLVPFKGEVLTAMTIFWLTGVLAYIDNHLMAYGAGIDEFLPYELRGDPELQKRAIVVQRLDMVDKECIVRAILTGSGWKSYKENGQVCGIELSPGLHDGSRIPGGPIFTPTTKAQIGHDEHVHFNSVDPKLAKLSIDIFSRASDCALRKDIVIADTKFEWGRFILNGLINYILADEVLTPDSSRLWDLKEYKEAQKQKKSPSGYDKEPARQWGKMVWTPFGSVGIHTLDPQNEEHLAFIANLPIPDKVITDTTARYLAIFERLVGKHVVDFQREEMHITA